jgi:hypothetical protein
VTGTLRAGSPRSVEVAAIAAVYDRERLGPGTAALARAARRRDIRRVGSGG